MAKGTGTNKQPPSDTVPDCSRLFTIRRGGRPRGGSCAIYFFVSEGFAGAKAQVVEMRLAASNWETVSLVGSHSGVFVLLLSYLLGVFSIRWCGHRGGGGGGGL